MQEFADSSGRDSQMSYQDLNDTNGCMPVDQASNKTFVSYMMKYEGMPLGLLAISSFRHFL